MSSPNGLGVGVRILKKIPQGVARLPQAKSPIKRHQATNALGSSNISKGKFVHGHCNVLHAFHEHLHGIFGAFKHGILVGKACEFAQETKYIT